MVFIGYNRVHIGYDLQESKRHGLKTDKKRGMLHVLDS